MNYSELMNQEDLKKLDNALTILGERKMKLEEAKRTMIDRGNLDFSFHDICADIRNLDVKIQATKDKLDRLRNPKQQEQSIEPVRLPAGWSNNFKR